MLDRIEDAIEDIKKGKLIIVVDDEDRENEGDFIAAAETITPEHINFMATVGRGLICAPIEEKRADELHLPLMVRTNTSLHETAFTISVDLIGNGCSTGISTFDRAMTIKALADQKFQTDDFARPGHIFPLRAKSGGVLRRSGHTEAAIDLARMAGLSPTGALVEILHEDGSMARLSYLETKAKDWGLKLISIKDLVEYRLQHEKLIKQVQQAKIEFFGKPFLLSVFKEIDQEVYHLAIQYGELNLGPSLIRVQQYFGISDSLDLMIYSDQSALMRPLKKMIEHGCGVLVLLGSTTVTPNPLFRLSSKETTISKPSNHDPREIGIGSQILQELGAKEIHVLSSQAQKLKGLQGFGINVLSHQAF